MQTRRCCPCSRDTLIQCLLASAAQTIAKEPRANSACPGIGVGVATPARDLSTAAETARLILSAQGMGPVQKASKATARAAARLAILALAAGHASYHFAPRAAAATEHVTAPSLGNYQGVIACTVGATLNMAMRRAKHAQGDSTAQTASLVRLGTMGAEIPIKTVTSSVDGALATSSIATTVRMAQEFARIRRPLVDLRETKETDCHMPPLEQCAEASLVQVSSTLCVEERENPNQVVKIRGHH